MKSECKSSGFGIAEVLIAAAMISAVVAGLNQMLSSTNKSSRKLDSQLELATVRQQINESVDCARTFPATTVPPCTAGTFIDLLRSDDTAVVTAAGTSIGNWSVKALCTDQGIDIRAARLNDAGRSVLGTLTYASLNPAWFRQDEVAGNLRYDWRHPKAQLITSIDRLRASPAPPAGVDRGSLCAYRFMGLTARRECLPGQVVFGANRDGTVFCIDPVVPDSCPNGEKARGLDPYGQLICEPNLWPNGSAPAVCGSNTQKVSALLPDGTVVCEDNVVSGLCSVGEKLSGFASNGMPICGSTLPGTSCPAGEKMVSINPDGTANCVETVVDSRCAAGQKIQGLNTDGSPICQDTIQDTAPCPIATDRVVGINSDGTRQCVSIVPGNQCGPGERAGGLNGDGTVQCVTSVPNTACPAGQKVVQLNTDGSVVCQTLPPTACPPGQRAFGINTDGTPLCNSLAATSCPLGQKIQSVDSVGNARCGTVVAAASCGFGQKVTSISASGSVSCASAPASTCPGGQAARGLNANGTLICGNPFTDRNCPAGQLVYAIQADGSLSCRAQEPPSISEVEVYGGSHTTCARLSSMKCPSGYYMWGYEAYQPTAGDRCRLRCRRWY